jgi:hypothetical protein
MVLIQGSVDLDRTSPLDNAPSANTLPDYFRALYPGVTDVVVPPALITAQERIDAYQPKQSDVSQATIIDREPAPLEAHAVAPAHEHPAEWTHKDHAWDFNADAAWFEDDLGPGVGGDFGACNRPGNPNQGVFNWCKTNMISTSWMVSGSATPVDVSPNDFRATGMTASFHTQSKLRADGLYCTDYILFVECSWDKKFEETVAIRQWKQVRWLNAAAEERRARAWSLEGSFQRLHVGIEVLNVDDGTCCNRH